MIPDNTEKPLDGRTREYADVKSTEPIVNETTTHYTEVGANLNTINKFKTVYKKSPEYTAFTPYRICPIGAHADNHLGKITGFAIDKGIHMAYGPKQNGIVEIASLQFPKRAQWHVSSTPGVKQNDWADHLRGATIVLNLRYQLHVGLVLS